MFFFQLLTNYDFFLVLLECYSHNYYKMAATEIKICTSFEKRKKIAFLRWIEATEVNKI